MTLAFPCLNTSQKHACAPLSQRYEQNPRKEHQETVGKYVGSGLDLHGNRNRVPRDMAEVMGIEGWQMGKPWESQPDSVLTDMVGRGEARGKVIFGYDCFPCPLPSFPLPSKGDFYRQREVCWLLEAISAHTLPELLEPVRPSSTQELRKPGPDTWVPRCCWGCGAHIAAVLSPVRCHDRD